jgi:hypothetical protein
MKSTTKAKTTRSEFEDAYLERCIGYGMEPNEPEIDDLFRAIGINETESIGWYLRVNLGRSGNAKKRIVGGRIVSVKWNGFAKSGRLTYEVRLSSGHTVNLSTWTERRPM